MSKISIKRYVSLHFIRECQKEAGNHFDIMRRTPSEIISIVPE